MTVSAYQGSHHFGLAYHHMYQNDSHAPGSVDRTLMDEMLFLCAETEAHLYDRFTPLILQYQAGSRPVLEEHLRKATAGAQSDEERVRAIAQFTAGLGERATNDLDVMLLGGTEEEIISRGSDWCTDLARVGSVLCQIAGLPARIVHLADTENAYSGHAITEVYWNGAWGAVDTTLGIVYANGSGSPTSAAAVRRQGELGQFRAIAIANYFAWESQRFDYTISGINPYYRSILDMSQQGWPGGLRWLHAEDGLE